MTLVLARKLQALSLRVAPNPGRSAIIRPPLTVWQMSRSKSMAHKWRRNKTQNGPQTESEGGTPSRGSATRSRSRGRESGHGSRARDRGSQRQGRKRRADDLGDASSRPGKSRRLETLPRMQYDEQTLLRTLSFPTKAEVPGLPRQIMSFPKAKLHDAIQGFAALSGEFQGANGRILQYNAVINLPEHGEIEAIGEGTDRRAAEKAAFLHLLAKLHQQDLVEQLWPSEEKVDGTTMREEKDSKLDVYIYAAKFGLVPEFTVGTAPTLRKRSQKLSEVTIKLPEQGIHVVSRNASAQKAEISAAIKFKQAAEKHLSETGRQSVLSERNSLTLGNAKSFFMWYMQEYPDTRFKVELERAQNSQHQAMAFVGSKQIGQPILMGSKKSAEDVATLLAAIVVTKNKPELVKEFLEVFRRNNNQILPRINPASATIDDNALDMMRRTLDDARRSGLGDQYDDVELENEDQASRTGRRRLSKMEIEFKSKELQQKYESYLTKNNLAELRKTRAGYPMNQYGKEVLEIVQKNLYSIIIGATGSGKTTQVPQILLNEAIERGEGGKCNIICTQPRRIAAKSIAQRVADERAENLTDSVGYHVRRDAKLPRMGGSIVYCTTGILSAQLQNSPDDVLDNVSHLIIDEVHERDIIIDFLLTTLKKLVTARLNEGKKIPQIVLMSATMDADLFANYFRIEHPAKGLIECPTLSVPGRTYPVKERHLNEIMDDMRKEHGVRWSSVINSDDDTRDYLEAEASFAKTNPSKIQSTNHLSEGDDQEESVIDWKSERGKALESRGMSYNEAEEALVPHGLVATTIAHILKTTQDGAILVFLPGLDNIMKVAETLQEKDVLGIDFKNESKYRTFMLHSSIPDTQKDVFDPMRPGCRKIILATNIAETSITIPDVQHVVDTGKLREKRYDQLRRITKLSCIWESKSNVKQRAGRAGRVQNGNYYALYCKERFETMRAVGLPELLRSDLQEICLDVRAQGFTDPVKDFLSESIEPPSEEAVDKALQNLIALDCLTVDERLTPLGRLLASLPIHPSLGKMIVLGVIFKCLDPVLILGSLVNERNLFLSPITSEAKQAANESKVRYAQGTGSDHIATLNAFKEMRFVSETRGANALYYLSRDNYLHVGAFKSIQGTAETIATVLAENQIIHATAKHRRADFQIGDPYMNVNSDKAGLVKALLLAGVYPNIGINTRGPLYRTPGENNALVHPASINNPLKGKVSHSREIPKDPKNQLLSYTTLAKSNDGNSTFMRETTRISSLMTWLFGGHLAPAMNSNRIIKMDDWLPWYLAGSDRNAVRTIIEFRKGLETMQSEAFAALQRRTLLAENHVMAAFRTGLLEILNIDAGISTKKKSEWDSLLNSSNRSKGAVDTEGSNGSTRERGRGSSGEGTDGAWAKLVDSYRPQNRDREPPRIDRYVPPSSRLAQHG